VEITINRASTLIEFLIQHYPDSPRTRIKKLLQSGDIRINNKSVTLHSFLLKPGDKVEIITQSGIKVKSVRLPFTILFEDPYVIVVDKPAGTATSSIDGSTSIFGILTDYLSKLSKGKIRPYVVHRLDKEVSGVLLFAKSQPAMDAIKERWKETDKHYYALVEGIPPKSEDTITGWLKEDNRQKVYSTDESAESKFAITHYKTLKVIDKYTLLDVKTETGRKNQIRVHLSDIGCPITGDRKYGASTDFIRRIRLHAYHLTFPHPVNNKMITVESPMPQGFLTLKPKDEKYK
jgi:23S rRNA pseudouridine1911/1915/1917 synthase